jgi:hypothetical protein
MKTTRKTKVVAEICLYGGSDAAGWLANPINPRPDDGHMLGDGEPHGGRCLTEAVELACDALRKSGVSCGHAYVYRPDGKARAEIDINHPGYFGDMRWRPAPQYVISAEAIKAAAAK